jgi:predicted Zn-dependent peptidase
MENRQAKPEAISPLSTTVTFADLTHTAVAVDANNNPLAVGYIAAYARRQFRSEIAPHLFKYPAALSRFLDRHTPAVACFTNYMWNERLSCAFAREIKRVAPRTIVVMGGPNYPVDAVEQESYLEAHPEIDFFVDGEGEVAFVNLFQALSDAGFDGARLRSRGTPVAGVHYVAEGRFVRGETVARILDLDATLPSPYTMGLLDEFFDDRLTPMVQTARGCPYACTFCHDGVAHMNKTRAFSADRVDEELAYIETRVRTPTLQLADLNWGMFPGDLRTAQRLAESRGRTGWPRNVMVATAKNQKERIVEMSRVLGDALQVMADVSLRPTFPAEELDRLRKERLTALLQARDNVAGIVQLAFPRIVYGPTHRYGTSANGLAPALGALTVDDLRAFYRAHYRPDNTTLIVVGDVTQASLLPMLEKAFGAWKSDGMQALDPVVPTAPQLTRRQVYLVDKPGAVQSQIRIGWVGVPRSTPDYVALEVLNTVLGGSFTSRLNQNLREQHGYTYGASSQFVFRRTAGPFLISSGVRTDVTAPSVTEIFKEVRRMRETPLTADELALAKDSLVRSLPAQFETSSSVTASTANIYTYDLGLDYYTKLPGRMSAVTADDVKVAAEKYVVPEKLLIVAVGDRARIAPELQKLNLGPVETRGADGMPVTGTARPTQ